MWQEDEDTPDIFVEYTKEEILRHPDREHISNLCYMVDENTYSGPPNGTTAESHSLHAT